MFVFTLSVFNSYISLLYLSVSTLIAKRPSLKVMSPWTFADLQTGLAAQISQALNKAPYRDQGLLLPFAHLAFQRLSQLAECWRSG